MKCRISMITLSVADLQRSIDFYQNGLGFPRMDSPEEVAFFPISGTWLGLYARESLAEDAGIPAEGSGFSGFTLAHNVQSEYEVDDVIALAISAGASLSKAAVRTAWGGYAGYFGDPDGHLWEVAHNPFVWVGPMDE